MNKKYKEWLNDKYIKEEDKQILRNMTPSEIESSFNKELKFGTAGIRGIMGLGNSKINEYTIGKVTVGLAKYLNKNFKNPSVVIAYDTRNNSDIFAKNVCLILNYYNIKTYLFSEYTSTPELSFAVKYLNCTNGIVITSSHNAKEYNGYKVYNKLGGQIVPPEDDLIIKEIESISSFEMIKYADENNKLFNVVSSDVHNAFLIENEKVIINKNLIKKHAKDIKVTYSSLHGVGIKTAKELLDKYNFNYNIVKEQCIYDSNFTTAKEPNPEYLFNYDLAKEYASKNNSDIIILTDPDADRVGVMYKDNNKYKYINGNMLGILFANYIIDNKTIKNNSYMIKSIVTTPMLNKMCELNNIKCYEVLTGCKNIAHKKEQLKDENYLFGYEESLGYMFDINVSDKNGFSSMLSILEIMCFCKENNIELGDYIDNIYKKYGYYQEETISITYDNIKDDLTSKIMGYFRENSPKFNNQNYVVTDYLKKDESINTNALKYVFNDDSFIILRPSGTEPKIKIYMGVKENNINDSQNKLNQLKEEINNIIEKLI